MAGGQRTVKIKFDGDAAGVKQAANDADRAVDSLNRKLGSRVGNLTSKLGSMLSSAVDAMPPMGKAVAGVLVAGLAVAMAPALGAAISSAVLLGLGGGALAIGIKAAIDNPRVVAAFEPLKARAKGVLEQFGKPFEGPLIRAAKTFDNALKSLTPAINRIGQALAPVIDDLAPAFAGFLKNAMPGIEAAVKASVPLFRILADKLPGIGRAVGIFFEKISANGDDTNQFFSDLIDLITNLIVGIGVAIAKVTSWYSNIRGFITNSKMRFLELRVAVLNEFAKILEGAAKAFSWVPGVGPKLKKAKEEFGRFRAQANAELAAIKDKQVRVKAYSNVGAVAVQVARTLRNIKDERVYVSVGSNVGSVVANINRQLAGVVSGRRASGGPVSAGRSYLVGERGPEILTMGSGGGNITPNRELGGGFAGDLYVEVDLGNAVRQVIKVENRDLKRRATMRGATV